MTEQFKKFKRWSLLIRLLKSLLAALASGSLIGGTLHFLFKFEILPMPIYSAWIFAAVAAVLAGACTYWILHINDRRLARQIDRDLGLQERVQTSLAFKDEESAIYELQRMDTEAALNSLPKKRLKVGRLWIYLVALLLGIAVLIPSFLFAPLVIPPEPEPEPEPVPEIPFALTEIQESALLALIETAQSSEMDSPYKDNIAASLTTLLDELRAATLMRERDASLSKAFTAINAETAASSDAIKIIEALWHSTDERVKLLAKAINFYDWTEEDGLDERMVEFRAQLKLLSATEEGYDEMQLLAEGAALLREVADNITLALVASGVAEDLDLVAALYNMANEETTVERFGLKGCAKVGESVGYHRMQDEWVEPKLNMHKVSIATALEHHATNVYTGEDIMRQLSELFNYPLPRFARPALIQSDTGVEDTPGGDDEGGGGGAIGGGTVYGSDDMVLDPVTNTFVEYGTLLNRYYAYMTEKLNNGNYSDAEREVLEKYFRILYGTSYEE